MKSAPAVAMRNANRTGFGRVNLRICFINFGKWAAKLSKLLGCSAKSYSVKNILVGLLRLCKKSRFESATAPQNARVGTFACQRHCGEAPQRAREGACAPRITIVLSPCEVPNPEQIRTQSDLMWAMVLPNERTVRKKFQGSRNDPWEFPEAGVQIARFKSRLVIPTREPENVRKNATPNTIRVFGADNQATMRSEIGVVGQLH